MSIYPLVFPKIFQFIFPSAIFQKHNKTNSVYLTFDDGPSPHITPFVLNELEKYNAKASFFCLGDKIKQYPDIMKEVVSGGHLIGNHTFHHLDAWKNSTKQYLEDTVKTEAVINLYTQGKKLFRPPFGHLTPLHTSILKKNGFQIILWTSISGDYKQELDISKVIQQLSSKTKAGDILVFHDSEKASKNLYKILPKLLENLYQKGLNFKTL